MIPIQARYHAPASGVVNLIPNNSNQGASAGSPGAFPSNGWSSTAVTNLTQSIPGFGIDTSNNNLPYIEVKFAGTTTATRDGAIYFGTTTSIPASPSTQYTLSFYFSYDAGTTTHFSGAALEVNEWSGNGGTYVTNNTLGLSGITTTPTQHVLTWTTSSTTTSLEPFLIPEFGVGAVAITLRIEGLQLQTGGTATPVLITPQGATIQVGGDGTGGTVSPPAQAVAAGFTSLVFNDDFTTSGTNGTIATSASQAQTAGVNWYWYTHGGSANPTYTVNTTAIPGVTDGQNAAAGSSKGWVEILTTGNNYAAGLVTLATSAANSTQGTGTFNTGYFECYCYTSFIVPTGGAAHAAGDSSFYLFDSRGWAQNGGSIPAGLYCAESDVVEFYPNGAAGTEVYCIHGLVNWGPTTTSSATPGSGAYSNAYPNNTPTGPMPFLDSQGTPASGWHKWGVLWQGNGTTGSVQYYVDDMLQTFPTVAVTNPTGSSFVLNANASPTAGYSAMPTAFMYLVLGSYDSSANGPFYVDWVRVWQAPA